jgi:hypothetical protein
MQIINTARTHEGAPKQVQTMSTGMKLFADRSTSDVTAGSERQANTNVQAGVATPQPGEAKPDDASDTQLSSKYAMYARKEKAIRSEAQRLKAEKAQFEAEKAAHKAQPAQSNLKQTILSDPIGFFTQQGLSAEEVANILLNQRPEDVAYRKIQAELQATREEQTNIKKSFEDREVQQREQAIKQIKAEIGSIVDKDENFETIKEMGMQDAVLELIEETFDKEGIILDVADAATEVENHLAEQAAKWAGLKRVKSKLTPAEVEAAVQTNEAKQTQPVAQAQQIRTLTHAATASPSKPLSARDRRERAIKAFLGQLTT